MGVCSSCLGSRRKSDSHSPERQRLLHRESSHRQYGGANTDHNSPQAEDPAELKRQTDALERICAQTADSLIDLSHNEDNGVGTRSTTDYARLFGEIFPPGMIPPVNADGPKPESEQAWLKMIMDKDPNDKSWDPNVVHKIDKPLTFTFD